MSRNFPNIPKFPNIPGDQAINFKDNHVVAKGGGGVTPGSTMTIDSVSQTRSAIDVTDERDPNHSIRYRVKAVLHGNQRACEEIYMQKLYELIPGTNSPHTLFGLNFHKRNEFAQSLPKKRDYAFNEKLKIPQYFVASPYTESEFQDLGSFLTDTARHLIPEKFREFDQDGNKLEVDDFEKVHEDSPYGQLKSKYNDIKGNKAADKVKKRDILFGMYDMLPQETKSQFDVIYYNSQWLGNWDFLNLSLFNSGFVYNSRSTTQEEAFTPTLIDFGNCGPTGFGGLYKEESLFRANTPAKPRKKPGHEEKESASDYDPDLEIHVTSDDVTLQSQHPSSTVGLSRLPRNLPFSKLLEKQIKAQFDHHDSGMKVADEALESAYSLLLVSDEAINAAMDKWHLVGDGKPIPCLELSKEDFDKIYPPTAIKEILLHMAEKEGALTQEQLHEKYSHDAVVELMGNLEKVIKSNEIKAANYLTKEEEVSPDIIEGLFMIVQERRKDLDQQYSCEGMKHIMKTRRDDFVNQFSGRDIVAWEGRNPHKAANLRKDAIGRRLGNGGREDEKEDGVEVDVKDLKQETFKRLNKFLNKFGNTQSGARDI